MTVENTPSKEHLLEKHFRNDEERAVKPRQKHWSKYIIDFHENKFLNRRPLSLLKLALFYILFYCILTGFCVSTYVVFSLHLDANIPHESKSQPGLSFAPAIKEMESVQSIVFSVSSVAERQPYVDNIERFLSKYGTTYKDKFQECNADGSWGYKNGDPCIFLKLNRVIGWNPQTYDSINQFPKEAPLNIKQSANQLEQGAIKDYIWVACKYSTTIEAEYYPGPYVLARYFKLDSKKSYDKSKALNEFYGESDLNRIVALHLKKIELNKQVKIFCNAWAKNIKQDLYRADEMLMFNVHLKK